MTASFGVYNCYYKTQWGVRVIGEESISGHTITQNGLLIDCCDKHAKARVALEHASLHRHPGETRYDGGIERGCESGEKELIG